MIYTHSLRGAGGASRNLHDWGRNYGVYHAERVVPTLLNSWEGAYFDFDAKVLKQMIDDAALMGLEMFVLDDGWFGNKYPRNAANAGLGDWQVNRKKLPAGIDDIASYAHRKGLKFGIWIEPEMVNPQERTGREASRLDRAPAEARSARNPQTMAAGPLEPRRAGLRLRDVRQHDEALGQDRLHQVGRQPQRQQCGFGLPPRRRTVALLDRLRAGIL